jgi:cytochrome c oxidase subunit 4
MDTAVEHAEDHGHAAGHTEKKDSYYVIIALILAGITAFEVWLSYAQDIVGPMFMPFLFLSMIVKFIMVVLFFMHLKFDSRIFSFLFWSGLILAVGVYVAFLATMKFFSS